MNRIYRSRVLLLIAALLAPLVITADASAHVVVKPAEAGVAAFQTFTVGVPTEKDIPTVALTLDIPEGLKHVSPNVKPGWNIEVKKTGEGEDASVTEIRWTGGAIPAGQRDEFLFSVQVPDNETTIEWKAYQTYSDGSVVSWDQSPVENASDEMREELEKAGKGPFSQTKVADDLASTTTAAQPAASQDRLPLFISIVAVVLATYALVRKPSKP